MGIAALAAGLEFPFESASLGIQGIEVAVITGEIHEPGRNRGRRRDGYSRSGTPVRFAGFKVDCVKVVISAAYMDEAVRDRR